MAAQITISPVGALLSRIRAFHMHLCSIGLQHVFIELTSCMCTPSPLDLHPHLICSCVSLMLNTQCVYVCVCVGGVLYYINLLDGYIILLDDYYVSSHRLDHNIISVSPRVQAQVEHSRKTASFLIT